LQDNFFELGGNSLRAMQLISRIGVQLGQRVRPHVLLEAPTIQQLAKLLDVESGTNSLVQVRAGEGRPAVFFVHDADGEVLLYRNLALRLNPGHAVYGIQPLMDARQVVQHTRMSDMVDHYISCIRSVQPNGPYILAGLCAGGAIAFEIARQLQEQGEEIATLALFDAVDIKAQPKRTHIMRKRVNRITQSVLPHAQDGVLNAVTVAIPRLLRGARGYLKYKATSALTKLTVRARVKALTYCLDRKVTPPPSVAGLSVREVLTCSEQALADTGLVRGDLTLFRATRSLNGDGDEPFIERYQDPLFGWTRRVRGSVISVDIEGGHSSMLQEPQVDALAKEFQACVDHGLQTV
jgi:thioesterase domain-containing protein/aryl carrier-like protein